MLKTRRKKNVKKGIQFCLMVCGASGTGTLPRHRYVPNACTNQRHLQAEQPSSTLCVASQYSSTRSQMIPPLPTRKRALRSSQSQSVRQAQRTKTLLLWIGIQLTLCIRTRGGGHPHLADHCRHPWFWRSDRQRGQVGNATSVLGITQLTIA